MNEIIKWIQGIFSLIGGYVMYLIGGVDSFLILLSYIVVLDIITGFFKALFEKTLSSKKMLRGSYKKILIFLVITLANLIDQNFNDLFLRQATIVYYIIQEGISIVENVHPYVDIPPTLLDFFKNIGEDKQND